MTDTRSRPQPPRAIEPHAIDLAQRRMLGPAAEREATRVLNVVCDLARFKILRALQATPLAASDLARIIGKTRSATSQHLRVLREVDAVRSERRGNIVRYRLNGSTVADVLMGIIDAFDRLAA